MTYSVISRCTNRMLIGKTYWKCVALPAILYGSNVIEWKVNEIEKLQVIQNQVCRKMLNAPKCATNSAIRSEVGMSTMSNRIIQGRLNYIISRREGNDLIRTVINELETNRGNWKTHTKKQCTKINMEQDFLQGKNKQEIIRKIINDKDTD